MFFKKLHKFVDPVRPEQINISDRSLSRSSKGATNVRSAFKAYFNSPTAAKQM